MMLESSCVLATPAISPSTASDSRHSEVQVIDGPDAIAQIESAWRDLAATGGVATPFQSWPVASAVAAAHVRRNETPRIVVVWKAGSPVIILPTVVTTWFGQPVIRFLGDPFIQYGDVLARPDATKKNFALAWSVAADRKVGCLALFRRVRDDAKSATLLAQTASEILVQESPLVDLRQPSVLDARHVRELRRLRRRLSENGPTLTRFVTGGEARQLLHEALRLKREWLKAHGLVSSVIGNDNWERAICDLYASGLGFTAAVLTVAGRLAAIEAALVDENSWYAFLGAFAPEFAPFGPGQVLAADCVDYARDLGLNYYDQLPPSQPYKLRLATNAIAVRDYASALTPAGHLVLAAAGMSPQVKSLFGMLPLELRRLILRCLRGVGPT